MTDRTAVADAGADDLIGTLDAAAVLRRSKSVVKYHVATGRLVPAFKMPGASGAFLFRRADVEALRDELDDERPKPLEGSA